MGCGENWANEQRYYLVLSNSKLHSRWQADVTYAQAEFGLKLTLKGRLCHRFSYAIMIASANNTPAVTSTIVKVKPFS